MYSKRASSPEYTTARPSFVVAIHAPSCAARPSAVRLTGVLAGSKGSISTTQPKRWNSLGCLLGVEALVVFGPAEEAGLAHAPARLVGIGLLGAVEVEGEVLLARQVRAPGRQTAGAVVQRAQHAQAFGVGGGLHQRVAGGRAADGEGRGGRETARVGRRPQHLPPPAFEPDLHHRHAVGGLRLAHLLGGPGLHAVAVQQAVVGVLVVHDEQAVRAAAGDGVVVDAVVVHAHLHRLVGRAVAGIHAPGRHVAGHADRFAPGHEGHGLVALGHDHRVLVGGRDALEAEPRPAARRQAAAAGQQPGGQRTQAALQPQPPRRVGHTVDVRIGAAVGVFHRVEVLGHAAVRRLRLSARFCLPAPAPK